MAFPVIESHATTENWTSGGSVTYPSGISAGDMLLMVFSGFAGDNTTSAWPMTASGWTINGLAGLRMAVGFRIADGTEGSTFTLNSVGSNGGEVWVARVSGAHPWPIIAAQSVTGVTSVPFTSLSAPSSGDVKWITAIGASANSSPTQTTPPSGYTELVDVVNTNFLAINHRDATGSSETPGNATVSVSIFTGVAATIGLLPDTFSFPYVVASTSSAVAQGTAISVNLPGTDVDGDLLVIGISKDDDNAPLTPSGWTALASDEGGSGNAGNNDWHTVFARRSNGSLGSSIVVDFNGDSEESSYIVYRIRGWNDTGTLSEGVESAVSGTGINGFDSTSLGTAFSAPSWASEDDYMTIGGAGWDSDSVVTAWSSEWPDNRLTANGGGNGSAGIAANTREWHNSGDMPSSSPSITIDAAETYGAWAIHVRPDQTTGENFTGTAAASNTSATSATGTSVRSSTASASHTSAATASGTKNLSGAATQVSHTSSATATGGPAAFGTATTSNASDAAVVGIRSHQVTISESNTSAVTSTGTRDSQGTASATHVSAATVSGLKSVYGVTSASHVSSVVVVGNASQDITGTASQAHTSATSATGTSARSGVASESNASAVTVTGLRSHSAALTDSFASSASVVGARAQDTTVSVSATSATSVVGVKAEDRSGIASESATSSTTVSGNTERLGTTSAASASSAAVTAYKSKTDTISLNYTQNISLTTVKFEAISLYPRSDVAAGGWTVEPLWSKINESAPDGVTVTADSS